MMTAVSPEPDDDEMHLLDADVEAANHEPRHGNAPDAPRISVSRDSLAKPKTPEDVGGRPRGVSRYVPTDQAPYSYQDLLSGQRDPNIPGPDKSLTLLTPAPLVHGMAASTKKYAHRASIGHDGRVMEDRARGVQTAVGRPKVKSIFHAMAGQRKFGEDGSEMHPKLVAVDVDAYGEEWTFVERRNVVIYACLQVVAWFVLAVADKDSWLRYQMDGKGGDNSEPRLIDWHFWCKLLANQGIFWAVFACCGLAVVTQDWNEGYSRKVCHVVMYLTPFLMHLAWPSASHGDDSSSSSSDPQMPTIWEMSWTVWFQFIPFYLQIKPIRRRSTFLMLVYRAYDRAQDRPYTLTWLLTQLAGGYVIILGLYLYLQARGAGVVPPGAGRAILIPIVVNVFGDGLAEPVGIRWGRHKYRARALWYDGQFCAGEFKRTLEGSAVVFFTTMAAVAPMYSPLGLFTKTQYALAMCLLPPLMTATEAFAPHTWDNPFITLVGAVYMLLTYELIP